MADNYYSSDNVQVFPSVFRSYNPSGKFTNETNFANIVKSVVDRDSYVIGYENECLKLIIFGYYFNIACNNPATDNGPLWAAIKVEQDTLANSYNLVSYNNASTTLDSDNIFRGIVTGDSGNPPSGQTDDPGVFYHSLILKIKEGSVWKLNTKRISSNSIYFDNTDDSLTKIINSKQDKINAGQGVKIYTEDNKLKVGIDDPQYDMLNGLKNMSYITENRKNKLNYFDDNGILSLSDANVGSAFSTSGNKSSTQSVYVNGGFITAGTSIYYSTAEPTNGTYTDGDIWIRYQG